MTMIRQFRTFTKFDYFLEDRIEAGMVLQGWEVKIMRAGDLIELSAKSNGRCLLKNMISNISSSVPKVS